MTAYQFSQPWLSKLDDPNWLPTAMEFAHLRDYLKGINDGTIQLFNPSFTNPVPVSNGGTGASTLTGYVKGTGTAALTGQAVPIPVADGGTNSTTALVNGYFIISSGGKIMEIPNAGSGFSANVNKITAISNGTAADDAAAFGQIKVLQTVLATGTTSTSSSSGTYVSTVLAGAITPTSASNRVLVSACTSLRMGGAGGRVEWRFDRSGTALSTLGEKDGAAEDPFYASFIDSPATTSARTYTLQMKVNAGAVTADWNVNGFTWVVILQEIV